MASCSCLPPETSSLQRRGTATSFFSPKKVELTEKINQQPPTTCYMYLFLDPTQHYWYRILNIKTEATAPRRNYNVTQIIGREYYCSTFQIETTAPTRTSHTQLVTTQLTTWTLLHQNKTRTNQWVTDHNNKGLPPLTTWDKTRRESAQSTQTTKERTYTKYAIQQASSPAYIICLWSPPTFPPIQKHRTNAESWNNHPSVRVKKWASRESIPTEEREEGKQKRGDRTNIESLRFNYNSKLSSYASCTTSEKGRLHRTIYIKNRPPNS